MEGQQVMKPPWEVPMQWAPGEHQKRKWDEADHIHSMYPRIVMSFNTIDKICTAKTPCASQGRAKENKNFTITHCALQERAFSSNSNGEKISSFHSVFLRARLCSMYFRHIDSFNLHNSLTRKYLIVIIIIIIIPFLATGGLQFATIIMLSCH